MTRMVVFFVVMTSLVVGLNAYVGWRLISPTWSAPARIAAWLALGVLVAVIPLAFLARFAPLSRGFLDLFSWFAFSSMGVLSLAFTFTALRDLGWLGARLAGGLPADPERRQALYQATNLGVLAVSFGAFAVGFVRARSKPTVIDVTVPIQDLPRALEGFRIAHISDVHVGPTIKGDFIEEVVSHVNALKPDLIAVTGDLVDGSVEELRAHTAPFAALEATHGSWFVTGNHEYYSGALPWLDEVRRLGMTALVNAHEVIVHNGVKLVVAGVTDISAGSMLPAHASDPHKAISGAPADAAVKLLLAHQPRSAYAAEKAGFDLQLSGHTHGGQYVPATVLVRLVQPFVEGLHKLERMWVYTNRGTGYWGPPIRHNTATEITNLVLVKA